MSETRYDFGTEALCRDGAVGQLTRVVLHPDEHLVTHVVIYPDDLGITPRLVELDRVSLANGKVALDFLKAELDGFPEAVHYDVPPPPTTGQVVVGQLLGGPLGMQAAYSVAAKETNIVPTGERGVDRGDSVQATDGPVGMLDGVLIDSADGRLTDLVVREGHLFSKREVAIPIELVTALGDGITLSVTRDELGDRVRDL